VTAHVNLGSFQVLWRPRRCLWLVRREGWLAYRWVVYVWPIEVRRFR